jgi:hypothetical protein
MPLNAPIDRARNTPRPPEPIAGFTTTGPPMLFAKSSADARLRVTIVRGCGTSLSVASHAFVEVRAMPAGSFTMSGPASSAARAGACCRARTG